MLRRTGNRKRKAGINAVEIVRGKLLCHYLWGSPTTSCFSAVLERHTERASHKDETSDRRRNISMLILTQHWYTSAQRGQGPLRPQFVWAEKYVSARIVDLTTMIMVVNHCMRQYLRAGGCENKTLNYETVKKRNETWRHKKCLVGSVVVHDSVSLVWLRIDFYQLIFTCLALSEYKHVNLAEPLNPTKYNMLYYACAPRQ